MRDPQLGGGGKILLVEREPSLDVLVIGAGGAGCFAAIKADEKGAKTAIVNKVPWLGGCTMIARALYSAALGVSDPRDNPDIHFRDTIRGGNYIGNQKIVKVMCNEVVEATLDLMDWGSPFVKGEDGRLDQGTRPSSLHTYPRKVHCHAHTGKAIMDGLSNEITRRGIKVLDNVIITNLLVENGVTVGAIGLHWRKGSMIVLPAKTVVMATGGTGHLYKFSDNPPFITGDGHAAAYRAGAELVDMEFCDFQLGTYNPPSLNRYPPNSTFWLENGGWLINNNAERFIKNYYPGKTEGDCSRTEINRAVWNEILEGRGTINSGVYLNLSSITENLMKTRTDILNHYKLAGIDLTWQPMEVTPGNHTYLGGLRIDENCESTNLKSLYAAGEAAGGWGGSNRLSGNAVAAAIGLGAKAGKSAAKRSELIEAPKIDEKKIEEEHIRITKILDRTEGVHPSKIKKEVQELMQRHVCLRREETGLLRALNRLKEIKTNLLPGMCIPQGREITRYLWLREALEAINIVDVGEIVSKAALIRKESRGSHQRSDYPSIDNKKWLKNVVIWREKGGMRSRNYPVTVSGMPLPTG